MSQTISTSAACNFRPNDTIKIERKKYPHEYTRWDKFKWFLFNKEAVTNCYCLVQRVPDNTTLVVEPFIEKKE